MSDIEKFIEDLLNSRTIREGAAFSSRSYSDTPIIQSGRQFKQQKELDREKRREARGAGHTQRGTNGSGSSSSGNDVLGTWRGNLSFSYQSTPSPKQSMPASSSSQQEPARAVRVEIRRYTSAPARKQREVLPKQYTELRRLEKDGAAKFMIYGSRGSNELFYKQAVLAAEFEDDYPLIDYVDYYFPTYAILSDEELRSYFSWRTKLRQNNVQAAPLAFAFMHIYELLCGVGTTPGAQGYRDICAFAQAYEEAAPDHALRLKSYLNDWLCDYVIYHGLNEEIKDFPRPRSQPLRQAVFTLLQAEGDALARMGRERRIIMPGTEPKAVDAHELFNALCVCSRYTLEKSRLTKTNREDIEGVAAIVFFKMVEHCSKRRNTDFVEGLFGYGSSDYYRMFGSAIFFDPHPHEDVQVRLSDTCSYTCKDGQWRQNLVCDSYARSKQLGEIMHALDCELRRQLNYPYPLKEKKIPKYLTKMIRESVAEWLRRKKEAEARQISVDLSKLAAIRAAASVTQEALLVDEEREELAASPSKPEAAAAKPAASTSSVEGLSELESRVLFAVFDGDPLNGILTAKDPLPSIIIDRINEQLFDLIGDAVIEFDAETPHLIEDYREELQELMFS